MAVVVVVVVVVVAVVVAVVVVVVKTSLVDLIFRKEYSFLQRKQ